MNEMQTQNQPGKAMVAHQAAGAHEALASDLVVPYIVICQSQSEAFTQKKADCGDIIRSTSSEKVGDPQNPIGIIPLHYPKSEWIIELKPKNASRFQYKKAFPRTAANETLPWSFWADEDGEEVPEGSKGAIPARRVKVLKLYALLLQDVVNAQEEEKKVSEGELPDPMKSLLPVVISFRSTSYNAGKALATFIKRAESLKAKAWSYVVPFIDIFTTNDQGSFYVWDMQENLTSAVPGQKKDASDSDKELFASVKKWAELVNSGVALRTDDTAETGEPEASRFVPSNDGAGIC